MITIIIDTDSPVHDHGSVVVFEGTDDAGATVRFAADHRIARDMLGIVAEEGELACGVEPWAVLR